MKHGRVTFGIIVLLLCATTRVGQAAQDYSGLLSSNITADSIVTELSMAGIPATFESAKSPGVQLGQIIATQNGLKIVLFLGHCPNDTGDKICDVGFNVILPDSKNILTEKMLANMNSGTLYAKATRIDRPNNQNLLRIVYSYYCGGVESTKPIIAIFQMFEVDVAKAVSIYKAG